MKRVTLLLFVLILCALPLAASRTHHLSAQGSRGWIRFWGTGKVHLSGKGTLTIKNASNLTVKMDGTWGEVKKLADGGEYHHFEGSIDSIGPGAHLEIRGWNLSIEVTGFGKAHFRGKGTYTLDGKPPVEWPDHPGKWVKVRFRR